MQLYNYIVKSDAGQTLKGKVEARDESAAANTLRQRGYVVIKLTSLTAGKSGGLLGKFNDRISSTDIVTFTQQLSTMVTSGLPLSDGLSILMTQAKPALARVVSEMLRDIQGGSSFAEAMAARKGVFSDVYIASIRAGEASGKLDEVLAKLAETEEKRREFAAKTKGALIYPVIVLIVMVVVMAIMMIVVIPQLTEMFADFGTELPIITRMLIEVSNFSKNFWWIIAAAIGCLVYVLRRWYKTKSGRWMIDSWLLKLPVYGVLRTQVALSDITRTLALLTASGISILEALEIVAKTSGNVLFEEALSNTAKGVEKGLPLATMLAREEVFPPLLSQMVSVGEETGQLSGIMTKVARYFESESENAIKNLTTAIEPLIMVVLGVGVAFLVLAIVMPIYQLTSSF
jgi:type IV pilus assembly protein PilC